MNCNLSVPVSKLRQYSFGTEVYSAILNIIANQGGRYQKGVTTRTVHLHLA